MQQEKMVITQVRAVVHQQDDIILVKFQTHDWHYTCISTWLTSTIISLSLDQELRFLVLILGVTSMTRSEWQWNTCGKQWCVISEPSQLLRVSSCSWTGNPQHAVYIIMIYYFILCLQDTCGCGINLWQFFLFLEMMSFRWQALGITR